MTQAGLGGAPGYRPEATLRFRVELVRQLKRRRTQAVFAFMALLPILLIVIFAVASAPVSFAAAQRGINLIDLATNSAVNFTMFMFFVTSGFFLVVVFALFFGDTIASEASWGSLRYLLALPVPRMRLLRQKLLVALTLSVGSLVSLTVVSWVAGGLAYGFDGVQTPVGFSLTEADALWRLAVIVAYLTTIMVLVGSLAALLSVWTDAPLAAVGGAVFMIIVSSILNQVEALGSFRDYLPTGYTYAWVGMLSDPPETDDMLRGVIYALVYSTIFLALAFWRFRRKDVVS